MGRIIDDVLKLSPRSFENLVYDLLVRRGLVNPVWRTPGADGGRDIEGVYPTVDLSGTSHVEKWYIECKRYEQSVDWPTVFEKLAYATNHGAEYLLICTTSTLSPKCRDEIATRERFGATPRVRAWEGHDLETFLSSDQLLLLKYSIGDNAEQQADLAVSPLLWASAKSSQNAYGFGVMSDHGPSVAVELAASLAELAAVGAERLKAGSAQRWKFDQARDLYDWCDVMAPIVDLSQFDSYGLS